MDKNNLKTTKALQSNAKGVTETNDSDVLEAIKIKLEQTKISLENNCYMTPCAVSPEEEQAHNTGVIKMMERERKRRLLCWFL